MKPKGTMVKRISGGYYVYEYRSVRDKDGKWHTKMGRCIGKIDPTLGFVPNSSGRVSEEVTCLDFGEWALAEANSRGTWELVLEHFHPADAEQIYVAALIHFVLGHTFVRDLARLVEMSVLSLRYPSLTLTDDVMDGLLEDLGCRQGQVMAFEQALADSSSKVVAIDGRVVGTDTSRHGLTNEVCHISWQGDPQQKQPILLMAFDAEDGRPVLSLMCEGEEIECANVADLLSQARFEGDTFVLARGIYDTELATPLTECGNHYVVALPEGTLAHKEVLCREMEGRFVWERGDEVTVVEYREDEVGGRRVIAYRDLSESTALQAAWLRTMGWRDDAIVQEFCDELAPLMGASVLETNLDVREWDAEAVYALYERCAGVETCLDYVQDGRDARSLCELDYYRAQGHAFISLVAGLIHREVADALAASGLEMSLSDVLTCAHMVKAAKRGSAWVVVNCTKESIEVFDALNTGLEVV